MLRLLDVCCDLCSDVFMIFSGGMPRASHGVRHTVSVLRGAHDHVVFDVTSKVVDFIVLCNGAKHQQGSRAVTVLIRQYSKMRSCCLHILHSKN